MILVCFFLSNYLYIYSTYYSRSCSCSSLVWPYDLILSAGKRNYFYKVFKFFNYYDCLDNFSCLGRRCLTTGFGSSSKRSAIWEFSLGIFITWIVIINWIWCVMFYSFFFYIYQHIHNQPTIYSFLSIILLLTNNSKRLTNHNFKSHRLNQPFHSQPAKASSHPRISYPTVTSFSRISSASRTARLCRKLVWFRPLRIPCPLRY